MKTFKLHLVGLALGLASTGCGDDGQTPTQEPDTDGGVKQQDANTAPQTTNTTTALTSATTNPAATNPAADSGIVDSGTTEVTPDASVPSNDAGVTNPVPFDGSCATLPGKIVVIESGDTQESLLKNLGRHLRDNTDITLVFNLTGSCTLINDIYTDAHIVPSGMLKYIPSSAEDPSWLPSTPAPTCTTGAEGVKIDLAISALFAESCALGAPPEDSDLKLIQGPIQAYTFVVPTASSQDAIGAEEAYYTFGFGAANPLAPDYNPWNQEDFMFIRPATKSTLVATAKNILVPPNKWKGVAQPASSDVLTAVTGSSEPDATIGILGAEVYDNNRDKSLKTLAFQAFDQDGAFYPDSTSSAFDKQNVRNGHYTLWSPTVYITKVHNDAPTNSDVATVLNQVLGAGNAGTAGFDGLADVVKVGLVPECAMLVTRSEDGGELSPFTPDAPCTCFYLSHIAGANGAPEGCVTCDDGTGCNGTDVCSHGFCEATDTELGGVEGTGCFTGTPATHDEIINACSEAQRLDKTVVLPGNTLQALP